jgi:cysteine desulfurase
MQCVYLDYAATTPVDPRVLKAMMPYFTEDFGNPGSLHSVGQKNSAAIFAARRALADAIGAHYSEIIFTGSATEANNLAIRGAIMYFQKKNPGVRPRILIPTIEHDCVLATAKGATELGAEVVYVPVSKDGLVDVAALKKALNARTVLISVMLANNEIGTIQPVVEIARIVRSFRESLPTSHKLQANSYPLLHTDAVQAFEYLPCNVAELGVDMMTLSAHKMYGPKGIGALYVKNRALTTRKPLRGTDRYLVEPIILGGGQEEGLRSGTENVPAIVGMGVAASLVAEIREKEASRLRVLRDQLLSGLKKVWPDLKVNGTLKQRLPNHLNIYIPGQAAEKILAALDLRGVVIASGSACSARSTLPSKVILAMGYDAVRAKNSLRITLGRLTTKKEIAEALKACAAVKKATVK